MGKLGMPTGGEDQAQRRRRTGRERMPRHDSATGYGAVDAREGEMSVRQRWVLPLRVMESAARGTAAAAVAADSAISTRAWPRAAWQRGWPSAVPETGSVGGRGNAKANANANATAKDEREEKERWARRHATAWQWW